MKLHTLPSVVVAMRAAGVIWVAFFVPVVVWNVFRIKDPAKTRRWMNRYWYRFPSGSLLPPRLDPSVVEQSRERVMERTEAVGWLVAVALLLYFTRAIWAGHL